MDGQKIFFTDLDGTLLNDEKLVPAKTRDAIFRFIEDGNIFVISTGRARLSAMKVAEKNGLDRNGVYISAMNGAHLYDIEKDETLLKKTLSMEMVKLIFDTAEEFGLHCQTYNDTHIIAKRDSAELQYNSRHANLPVLITKDICSALKEPVCKCLITDLHDYDLLERCRAELIKRTGDAFNMFHSERLFLEVNPAGTDKGTGLTWLCEYLGIPVKNSFAAGDGENDISMIKAAGLGIAMCNAPEHVRRAADVVTTADNNHNGLLPFIK